METITKYFDMKRGKKLKVVYKVDSWGFEHPISRKIIKEVDKNGN